MNKFIAGLVSPAVAGGAAARVFPSETVRLEENPQLVKTAGIQAN